MLMKVKNCQQYEVYMSLIQNKYRAECEQQAFLQPNNRSKYFKGYISILQQRSQNSSHACCHVYKLFLMIIGNRQMRRVGDGPEN